MFNVTHAAKPGKCKRRRCSHDAVEHGLCQKDLDEWRAAGEPVFSAQGTPVMGGSLLIEGGANALAEERISAQKVLERVQEIQITSQETMDVAGEWLNGVRMARQEVKGKMAAAMAPLKKALIQQESLFKPVDQIYAEAEALLRDRINNHIRMQDEAQDRARVAVEAAGGSVDENTLVVAHGIENVALPVGMGVRECWKGEVTDEVALRRGVALTELVTAIMGCVTAKYMTEESGTALVKDVAKCLGVGLAPANLLAVNGKAVDAIARTAKNLQVVPGINITLVTTATAARRGR